MVVKVSDVSELWPSCRHRHLEGRRAVVEVAEVPPGQSGSGGRHRCNLCRFENNNVVMETSLNWMPARVSASQNQAATTHHPPPPEAPAEAGAEDLCSLSAAVKRLKVLRRCRSVFEPRLWFFFVCVRVFCFLLHQVHNAVTASQCLQLPPFR